MTRPRHGVCRACGDLYDYDRECERCGLPTRCACDKCACKGKPHGRGVRLASGVRLSDVGLAELGFRGFGNRDD